ncbi:MAG TPA: mechanosensitive ion channel family protein [Candidatus Sulfomarinibacteraceae bacterium]|nr:mechanosensitive ion channel family protein [Candidatus Sulfomarinibacteraceae bacterium]
MRRPRNRLLIALVVVAAASTAAIRPLSAEPTPTPAAGVEDPAAALSDAELARAVERRLRAFEDLESVRVGVESGVVRLEGEVSTVQEWRLAEELARATEGVGAVTNAVEISGDVLGQVDALRETLARAANFAPVVGFAIAVLLVFVLLSWLVGRWSGLFARLSPNRFVQEVAQTAVRSGLILTGVVLALHVVDATAIAGALVGTAGVAGIAIGFAFKDLIENYLASVLLSLRQPFAPNDHVDIDGFEGMVVRLTSRATILMTLDGNHVRIPNARVFKGVIVNYTRNPRRRFDFDLGLAAESDLSAAKAVGEEVLRRMARVLDDPPPWSQIEAVGDSSVPIRYYGWVDQRESNCPRASSEAIRLVKEALEAAGFELPEPIYRIRSETPAREPAERREAGVSVELRADIAEHGDPIVGQIEEERRAVEPSDLLDPTAPQE